MQDNQSNQPGTAPGDMTCSQRRENDAAEREYREKVRASVERVRQQNREILDRLATK